MTRAPPCATTWEMSTVSTERPSDEEMASALQQRGQRWREANTTPAAVDVRAATATRADIAARTRRSNRRLRAWLAAGTTAAAVLAIVVLVVSLGSPGGNRSAGPVGAELTGVWRLTAMHDDDGAALTVARPAELRLRSTQIDVSDGCNDHSGTITISPGVINLGRGLGSTLGGCFGGPADETAEIQLINAVYTDEVRWSLDGDQLTISRAGAGSLTYTAIRNVTSTSAADLDGVMWELVTVKSGTTSSPAPEGIVFDPTNGLRMAQAAPCNAVDVHPNVGDGRMTVSGPEPPATCPELIRQTLQIFHGDLSWAIDDDVLTVSKSGVGSLVFEHQWRADTDLAGDWSLVGMKGPDGASMLVVAPARLTIKGEDLTGTDACNNIMAEIVVNAHTIDIYNLGSTEMGCVNRPDGFDAEVQLIHSVLGDKVDWSITGDLLTISRDGAGSLTYRAVQHVMTTDPADLLGHSWQLTTVIIGSGPDGSASSVPTQIMLALDKDGTATVGDGCEQFSSQFSVASGTLSVVNSPTTPTCSTAVPQIARILTGSLSWSITDDVLALTKDGVGGLVYKLVEF
jgi:heat shock protein HslJ